MTRGTILKISYVASIALTIWGAFQKITHSGDADNLLMVGIIASAVFIITAIIDVHKMAGLRRTEKTMWTFAFLLFSGIAGLVYLIQRNRLVQDRTPGSMTY